MKSLLSKVQKSEIFTEPFPHLIIKDPIDDEVCLQLISEFPDLETVTKGANYASNERFSYSTVDILGNDQITPLWQEFVKVHTSQFFLEEIINLFAEEILQIYPDFEQNIGKLAQLSAGIRNIDDFSPKNVLLDAQICVNTPVVNYPSSVRGPHVDNANKLFAGLYYLRDPRDTNSTGGNLEIHRYKYQNYRFSKRQFINNEDVEVVKTIKYERNVLVFLLNSEMSLHGVTVRNITDHTRYFFNLLGEVNQPLFTMKGIEEKPKLKKIGLANSSLKTKLKKLARKILRH